MEKQEEQKEEPLKPLTLSIIRKYARRPFVPIPEEQRFREWRERVKVNTKRSNVEY